MSSESSYETDEYKREKRKLRSRTSSRKRMKREPSLPPASVENPVSLSPLIQTLAETEDFERTMEGFLPDFLSTRNRIISTAVEKDESNREVRPLTRYETTMFLKGLEQKDATFQSSIISRKLKLGLQLGQLNYPLSSQSQPLTVTSLSPTVQTPTINPDILDSLYDIHTTPYDRSFLSRLHGAIPSAVPGVIATDWETVTPWMAAMTDVRLHYSLLHPEREQPIEVVAPIVYMTLQEWHLDQVHDLLRRTFWTGIDVSDALHYSPDRCTVVATYKRLVVGIIILSSPQETYITYLAVKAGWDNSHIATIMLNHLIKLNPHKDITLHVSVNNPAMLLYNCFGFKAEEFIVGFYEEYLDPHSKASMNAFRLRLRQQ